VDKLQRLFLKLLFQRLSAKRHAAFYVNSSASYGNNCSKNSTAGLRSRIGGILFLNSFRPISQLWSPGRFTIRAGHLVARNIKIVAPFQTTSVSTWWRISRQRNKISSNGKQYCNLRSLPHNCANLIWRTLVYKWRKSRTGVWTHSTDGHHAWNCHAFIVLCRNLCGRLSWLLVLVNF